MKEVEVGWHPLSDIFKRPLFASATGQELARYKEVALAASMKHETPSNQFM